NAHHFIDGFDGRPEAEARAFLAAHPDLYHLQDGRARLKLVQGQLALGSLETPGFGSGVSPVLDGTAPMLKAAWPRP
ncbi:MAG: mandelate racemase, partial [Variovorax sp.]